MLAHAAQSAATSIPPSLMRELETALASGSVQRRNDMLHRVTDLFIGHATQLSESQTTLFDDVMTRLIGHIETRTLAELSARLAPVANAPAGVIRRFAYDDAIAVSGPVLQHSDRLSDADLIEIATTKSQAHLGHIARRREPERGGDRYAGRSRRHAGRHHGRRQPRRPLLRNGMSKLVVLADGNDPLTEAIGVRSDIPPQLFRQLLAQAAETVRDRLIAKARPEARETMRQILADIEAQVGASTVTQRAYAEAQRVVNALSQDTDQMKSRIFQFADGNRVAELVAALSVLSGVTINQVDRLFHAPSFYGMMVLCKALALDWHVAEAVLRVRPNSPSVASDIEEARREYPWLSVASAQRLFRFWRVRQSVT